MEICGVNTSELKVLSEEKQAQLLGRMAKGDKAAREEFINGNLKLVLSVIQRFAGRAESPDDLFQVGCVGLIKALDNFDVTQQVRFSTYAVPMIIGEIRRYLRDNNPIRVSRSMRDTAYKALAAKERLMAEMNVEPTVEQISRELGMPREEVVVAMDAIAAPMSLSEPVFGQADDTIYIMDQVSDKSDGASDWIEEIELRRAIKELTDRERKILSLRYFSGKTQVEVSEEIGISQAQVSRLEKSALGHIKRRMGSE